MAMQYQLGKNGFWNYEEVPENSFQPKDLPGTSDYAAAASGAGPEAGAPTEIPASENTLMGSLGGAAAAKGNPYVAGGKIALDAIQKVYDDKNKLAKAKYDAKLKQYSATQNNLHLLAAATTKV